MRISYHNNLNKNVKKYMKYEEKKKRKTFQLFFPGLEIYVVLARNI